VVAYAGASSQGGHSSVETAFTTRGFNNWKAALKKKKGFEKHGLSSGHRHALYAYKNYLMEKSVASKVDAQYDEALSARQRAIQANRSVLSHIFRVVRLLARMCLPFRAHYETSANKGLFLEFVHFPTGYLLQ